ncbi:MAG: hypothetical protein GY795_43205 [Desulfobacterales bacterium]|nr:hypothetical protein [Desulfobacterales bacterium]
MPATTLDKVYGFFKNKPISKEDFDELYVPADKGRGKPVFDRLKRRLDEEPDGSLKILFAGHKGCGKTTELLRLQKNIEKDFIVLNFSVIKELDIQNISYIELFIVTMEKLFKFVKGQEEQEKIEIDKQYFENIKNWLRSEEIEEINEKHLGMDIETGVKSGVSIPFLVDFFAKFKAAAKSSVSMKETLKTKVEPKLSELIQNCNLFINEIKGKLTGINKKGLVIIIEDLDKLDIEKGEHIFYEHSQQLAQLNCHCIFTFPIALLYNIRFNAIKKSYDEEYVLPMIKVATKEGVKYDEGIAVIKNIVKKRMEISLFDNELILDDMIKYSGGCLWDMFQMVRDASDSALDFERHRIIREDFDSAYRALKLDYEFTIAENKEKEITVDEYYETLVSCVKNKNKKPKSTDAMLDLRNNLTVLSYNDIGWSDVHPIVKDILKENGMI